ncbi:MAG: chemotaxis protein CheC [Lachnospiraceae bacterium]
MQELTLEELNDRYVDVLREIGNIGSGNATTAIASMIGVRLHMSVPTVKLLEASKLGSAICPEDEIIVGIFLEVNKDINGSMMFVLKLDSAKYLTNSLMMRDKHHEVQFDEMELSALKEVGNIIAASYLSAISHLTNMVIAPSVPYLSIDMAASILSVPAIEFGQYGDHALLIETQFGGENEIQGYFILMPEQNSYVKILTALGLTI